MNEKAFNDLVNQNAPALTAYAYTRCGDMHLAQDIVQEAFLKYIKHHREVRSPRSWLYRTCRNGLVDSFRKNRAEHLGQDALEILPDAGRLPLEGMERDELYEAMFKCMDMLKESDSEIINLRYFGNLSYFEIAKVLEISPISAGVRLKRALDSLRKTMRSKPEGKKDD